MEPPKIPTVRVARGRSSFGKRGAPSTACAAASYQGSSSEVGAAIDSSMPIAAKPPQQIDSRPTDIERGSGADMAAIERCQSAPRLRS